MDAKSRLLLAVPQPFAATTLGYAAARIAGAPIDAAVVLAGVSGGFTLACVALIVINMAIAERQETIRTGQPYYAQRKIADGETRRHLIRTRASTRRFWPAKDDSAYAPPPPTSLDQVLRASRNLTPANGVTEDPPPSSGAALESPNPAPLPETQSDATSDPMPCPEGHPTTNGQPSEGTPVSTE
jgi:hypothetical protein